MSKGELFVPNPKFEADRLLVVEHALGEGGLIDKHLSWVEAKDSPSAEVSDRDYGYLPQRFGGDNTGLRPSHEPVDFRARATDTLGLDYDVAYPELVDRVNEVDSSWFKHLVDVELISPDQGIAMLKAANQAYCLDTLTEDNLPAYVAILFGSYHALAKSKGIKIPASEEWARGIWTGEENGHMLSMNEYGNITEILSSKEHAAGRNSQLRAGTEIELKHVIQLYAYVAWQELSTNYAHARKGKLFGPVGHDLLIRIGQDEARHHNLYQGALEALYIAFPDDVIRTLDAMFRFPGLEMPGNKGISDFARRGVRMHGSGIFGLEHAYKAARSVVQKLGILDRNKEVDGLGPEGVLAREELRERFQSPPAPRKRTAKFVIGQTLTIADISKARRDYADKTGLPARRYEAA